MSPTMYRCGILVVTLLSVALGEDVLPTSPIALSTMHTDAPLSMSDFCFFGMFPSASCRFKCHLKNKESVCNAEKKMCLCSSNDEAAEDSGEAFGPPQPAAAAVPLQPHLTITLHPVTAAPDNEPNSGQTNTNRNHVVFYIHDLKKILGQKAAAKDMNTTVVADSSQGGPEVVAAAGWNYQHLLALLIILLLVVLMVIEIYAIYKRSSANNSTDNINAIIIPTLKKT